MATSLCIPLLFFQVFLCYISTGVAGQNRTIETFHSPISTSLFASYSPLLNFTSSHIHLNLTHETTSPSISFSTLSRNLFSTFFIMNSTSVTPTTYQYSTTSFVSRTMIFNVSQTAPSVPPNNSPRNVRYRNIEDIVSIAVLLSLSGICGIMLLALFVKFLVDLRRRHDTLIEVS